MQTVRLPARTLPISMSTVTPGQLAISTLLPVRVAKRLLFPVFGAPRRAATLSQPLSLACRGPSPWSCRGLASATL